MKIGEIDLGEQPVMLAPMEDVTDGSFRLLCKESGADMVYTEFVSADALIRNIAATTRKLAIRAEERPVAIQIYGREPDVMVEAARIVEEARPDFIDINFGCPVKKVAGKGAGAGLLRDVPKMLAITRAVVDVVRLPVTVKTRLGWDHDSRIIVDLAERLQDCGIAALTVHGRTRSQMYTGSADWEMIARVKENPRLRIPVIGNGDVCTRAQVEDAFNRYGVDGVMVGRASIGAPWIFRELKGLDPLPVQERFDMLRRQILESVERIDPIRGILHIRRHLAVTPLFKGIPDFKSTRIKILQTSDLDELMSLIDHVQHTYYNI
ncbi:MAG: tRNA dihydrouridine synthase DusB [Muribaculaceae bacterium]|nr:tRNA dihydrouridine synthase DusB [Muribaculaceae bacterium]